MNANHDSQLESRRSLLRLAGLGAPLLLTLAACGEAVAEPEPTPAEEVTPESLGENLAAQLPAMPEMRAGRTDHLERRTETGRFDRAVYFSELTPGHVLNYYLDEMPALGWTELSRSELTARGGRTRVREPQRHPAPLHQGRAPRPQHLLRRPRAHHHPPLTPATHQPSAPRTSFVVSLFLS